MNEIKWVATHGMEWCGHYHDTDKQARACANQKMDLARKAGDDIEWWIIGEVLLQTPQPF